MKRVLINRLTKERFDRYGSFASFISPEGDKIGCNPIEFYRDMAQQGISGVPNVSYSSCVVYKRPLIIDVTESHNFCHEAIISLSGDCLIHVAPACLKDEAPFDNIEIFFVPQGTLIIIKAGVWHHAPLAYKCDIAHVLVALPERTYVNDCTVIKIPKEKQIHIEDAISE